MTSETARYRRILRRETHSSRAGAAITVAVILMVLLAAAGTACIYLIVHAPALAALRAAGLPQITGLRPALRTAVIVAAAVAMALGVLLIVLAVRPGRRPRRRLDSQRVAAVADDVVIGRALARQVADAAGIAPAQTKVIVAHHRAIARITPTAGLAVDAASVIDELARAGSVYGLDRRPRAVVAERAVVG